MTITFDVGDVFTGFAIGAILTALLFTTFHKY